MKYRKLRIAWSVVWGIAAVLLLVLWVRTNYWQDAIFRRTSKQQVLIESAYGRAILTVEYQILPSTSITTGWDHSTGPTDTKSWPKEGILFPAGMWFGFAYIHRPGGLVAIAPYWSLVTFGVVLTSPVWQYLYDQSGNQTHVIDPMGNDTEYVYDVRNRVLQVIQPFTPPPEDLEAGGADEFVPCREYQSGDRPAK